MLNPSSIRRRWRENASLRHFQNCNMLIINHFRNYGVEDEPNSGLMYANTPWSGNYKVQGTIWATAHTTQFAMPGWQYLDSASGYLPEKGSYVTLRAPDSKNWSVVLETINATHPQAVSFRLAGGLAGTEVHIWETNSSHTFEQVARVKPVNGTFQYTF